MFTNTLDAIYLRARRFRSGESCRNLAINLPENLAIATLKTEKAIKNKFECVDRTF